MNTLHYYMMDPAGNVTALVDTAVPVERQAAVAAQLMALEPTAEQVGFLSEGEGCDVTLRMAGGEFCGNATMSAAALWALLRGEPVEDGMDVSVRVSGLSEPVSVQLVELAEDTCRGTVSMPAPTSVTRAALPLDGVTEEFPVVHFDGISHVILERPAPETDVDRAYAESLIAEWCKALAVDAVGILFLDRDVGRMTPLVHVPAVGTTCWESACGSGTAAVGAYLAAETGRPVDLSLSEPGGTLEITVSKDGALTMSGDVRVLSGEHMYID